MVVTQSEQGHCVAYCQQHWGHQVLGFHDSHATLSKTALQMARQSQAHFAQTMT